MALVVSFVRFVVGVSLATSADRDEVRERRFTSRHKSDWSSVCSSVPVELHRLEPLDCNSVAFDCCSLVASEFFEFDGNLLVVSLVLPKKSGTNSGTSGFRLRSSLLLAVLFEFGCSDCAPGKGDRATNDGANLKWKEQKKTRVSDLLRFGPKPISEKSNVRGN